MKSPVTFLSHNIEIAGVLYLPDDYDGRPLAGVVVAHPAGGVKEQTAGRYAEDLSRKGFATLTFDAARQGESGGAPRGLEDPFQRAEDIRSAVTFLSTRRFVDERRVGILGVCAGGSYVSYTAQTDRRMRAVATVSAVDPAAELLEHPETREALLNQAGLLRNLEGRGEGPFLTHVNPGTRAEAEAYPARSMFRECYDYYVDGIGKHANSTGWGLLQFDVLAHFRPFEHIDWIAPRPLLMIAGTEADTRHFSEAAVARAGETAELFDIEGASHMDLYYKDAFVSKAIDKLAGFYEKHLAA
ncbi:MAG: alpha/beta hydrolase [Proteobacteria bacterium]|nr:alpha/beta hydrolase [Pseudomonadota bacterium]